MIAFSFLIPDSLDSLKKKKKRNCFWEAAEGAGKLRNWPPMENRKAVPLIKSSRLPLHLQRWEPSWQGRLSPCWLALWAGGRDRPYRAVLRALRRGGSGCCQALSTGCLRSRTPTRFLLPPPKGDTGLQAGCSDAELRELRFAQNHLLFLPSQTEKFPFNFSKKCSQHQASTWAPFLESAFPKSFCNYVYIRIQPHCIQVSSILFIL